MLEKCLYNPEKLRCYKLYLITLEKLKISLVFLNRVRKVEWVLQGKLVIIFLNFNFNIKKRLPKNAQ